MESIKKVTPEQIIDFIKSQITAEQQGIFLHNEIAKALKPFEGKQVSKRIATALQKMHPGWTVFYDTDYGMFHLCIWGGDTDIKYDQRFRALIGYESEPIVSIGKTSDSRGFEYFDCCHGSAAIERNSLRHAIIDNPAKVQSIVDAINNYGDALATLENTITYPNPDEYSLVRLAYNGKYGTWHK
jgi:hypothetical protein